MSRRVLVWFGVETATSFSRTGHGRPTSMPVSWSLSVAPARNFQ
ncbi:hypothetical protein A2U01_0065731, partial [Trifolium medium]|nr:hypothetical protein [Trifolium medium]